METVGVPELVLLYIRLAGSKRFTATEFSTAVSHGTSTNATAPVPTLHQYVS